MSSDAETTRILRSWLDDGVTELPDRVLDAVLDQVPATPQHRATWWPVRRSPTMNKFVGVSLAAAAVLVVVFVGLQLYGGGNLGGPGPSPSGTPVATPVATPEATPAPTPVSNVDFTALEAGGTELLPGSYVITYASPIEVTFTVPDEPFGEWPSAWYKACCDAGPHHQSNQAVVGAAIVDNLYLDPCAPELGVLDPALGPAVDDLVTALGAVPGLGVGAVTDVVIDGYAGRLVELTGAEPPPAECVEDPLVWVSTDEAGLLMPATGDAVRVWVLDVQSTRLVIWTRVDAASEYADDAQALVDSFQIEVP